MTRPAGAWLGSIGPRGQGRTDGFGGKGLGVSFISVTADPGPCDDDPLARAIAAARSGDAQVLGRLLDACGGYLRLVAGSELSRDLAAKVSASDLVQETFLGAHRDFARFRGRTEAELRAWLRGILLHNLGRIRRHYRDTDKRQVRRESAVVHGGPSGPWPVLADQSTTPATRAVNRERVEAVLAALQRLPEPHRSVVIWHQCEGETFEAIGRRLGRTDEATRKLWARALIRLTDDLGPAHDPRS